MLHHLSLSRLFGSESVDEAIKPSPKRVEKTDHRTPGALGIMVQSITPNLAVALGLKSTGGVLITSVAPEGPAATSGLSTGDIIAAYAGQKITDARSIVRAVAESDPGRRVTLDIVRNGKAESVSATIEASKDDTGGAYVAGDSRDYGVYECRPLGLSLGSLPETLRRQHGLPHEVTGALVVEVQPECQADDPGIQAGDILMRIDNTDVRDPADAGMQAEQRHKGAVAVLIERAGKNRFVGVALGEL
jgi:serine protease Do